MTKKIALIIFATTILVGCTKSQDTSVNIDQSNTESAAGSKDTTTFSTKSSGDVDKDIEEIEAAIDSLDVDKDFPTFDEDSI